MIRIKGSLHFVSGKYLSEYAQLKGAVSLASSVLPFSTVESDEKCAQSCSNNADCKMFEYCTNTQQCVLYDERDVGTKTNLSLAACNFFISKYII